MSWISNCCGESPSGEICADNLGFCSKCHEGALFEKEAEETPIWICDDCGSTNLQETILVNVNNYKHIDGRICFKMVEPSSQEEIYCCDCLDYVSITEKGETDENE